MTVQQASPRKKVDRRSASLPRLRKPRAALSCLFGPSAVWATPYNVSYEYHYSKMNGEGNMDEAETDAAPDVDGDGDVGIDDIVSNGDLANRRRRQQVRQACQQCRRRKIKVIIPTHSLTRTSTALSSNLTDQCDEVRPVCRPCLKARLACAYELPPGQTRAQAMVESQQRLREELHSHTSFIHALRCTDANSSVQMLSRLRRGDYDTALPGAELATRSHSPGSRLYPWEEHAGERQRRRSRDAEMLPPIESFPPGRHDSAPHYLPHHDRAPIPAQAFPPSYPAPQNIPVDMMNSNRMHAYDARLPTNSRPEPQYQQRGNPSYQQLGIPHPSTLPSNDANMANWAHQRPR
jgi:hypothetical protein